MVNLCLDPTMQLLDFYSMNMSHKPAVGVEHVDVSALLQEVTALHAEVRSLTDVRSEIAAIVNYQQLSADRVTSVGV